MSRKNEIEATSNSALMTLLRRYAVCGSELGEGGGTRGRGEGGKGEGAMRRKPMLTARTYSNTTTPKKRRARYVCASCHSHHRALTSASPIRLIASSPLLPFPHSHVPPIPVPRGFEPETAYSRYESFR